MEKTTIRRVNDVIIMTIDGAKDKTVMSANTLNMRAVAVPVEASPKLRLMFWANAKSQQQKNVYKKIDIKSSLLVMS